MRRHSEGQADLDFAAQESAAPVASLEDVKALVAALQAGKTSEAVQKRGGWMTAEELATALSKPGKPWAERKVRATARAAAPGIVSFPGSKGYKLWADCSVEEITHCIESFESQAKDMTQRAVLYRSAYHKGFRG